MGNYVKEKIILCSECGMHAECFVNQEKKRCAERRINLKTKKQEESITGMVYIEIPICTRFTLSVYITLYNVWRSSFT